MLRLGQSQSHRSDSDTVTLVNTINLSSLEASRAQGQTAAAPSDAASGTGSFS